MPVKRSLENHETVRVYNTTKTGVELITEERARQIKVEKWTTEHDDHHDKDELAWAAVCLAAPDRVYVHKKYAKQIAFVDPWPWDPPYDKRPHPALGNYPEPEQATLDQRIDLCVKAGALLAAELDRLQRIKNADVKKLVDGNPC